MPRQFDIFAANLTGLTLIEASAGTGKTHSLSGLYLRCLMEIPDLTVEALLVVTYTEAATLDLKARIRTVLTRAITAFATGDTEDPLINGFLRHYGAERCRSQVPHVTHELRNFDQASIFTIHGFCRRLLRDHAFETGNLFDTPLEPDVSRLVMQSADAFWRDTVLSLHPTLVAYLVEKKITPDALLLRLRQWLYRPGITVIPDDAPPALDALVDASESVAADLRKCWREHDVEIRNILMSAIDRDELNKNSTKKIKRGIEGVASWLTGTMKRPPKDTIESLTKTYLTGCTKKAYADHPPEHRFFFLCDAAQSTFAVLDDGMKRAFAGLQRDFLIYMQNALPAANAMVNVMSFDDLLRLVHSALHSEKSAHAFTSAVRKRYRVAMIDEFQDTDPLQLDIVRSLFHSPDHTVFLIGDPKQAIYSFRGADVFTYLSARSLAQDEFTLGVNWRSETGLVDAVNAIFGRMPESFVLDRMPYHSVSSSGMADEAPITEAGQRHPGMQIWTIPPTSHGKKIGQAAAEALALQGVTREIRRLLDPNEAVQIGIAPLEASNIAILVRRNDQAVLVKNELDALGVPAVMQSTQSLFGSDEVGDVLLIIDAVAAPRAERRVAAALTTDILGISAPELENLRHDLDRWENIMQEFRDYHDLWTSHGFITMFGTLIRQREVRQRLLRLRNGERRLTNVLHAGEVLHRAADTHHLGIRGLVNWFLDRIADGANATDEYELRLARDTDAVTIITVHKSKGLQFPVVFVPFSWSESKTINKDHPITFHRRSGTDYELVLDLGSDDRDAHLGLAAKENLAEDTRLLYVALTRAINRCYVVVASAQQKSAVSRLLCATETPSGNETTNLFEHAELPLPPRADTVVEQEPVAEPLTYCRLNARIDRSWKVTSFSFLAHSAEHADLPDRDAAASPKQDAVVEASGDAHDIFSYPAGSVYGSLLHDILECCDYTEDNPETFRQLIRLKHEEYGKPHLRDYFPAVETMLKTVLALPLDPNDHGMALRSIPWEARKNELEFHYPLQAFSRRRLRDLFAEHGHDRIGADFPTTIDRLTFHPVKGLLKGYIDLVFEWQDRYYIVDWKSNWLGNRPEDYDRPAVSRVMHDQFYILQYHLYVLALHLYLRHRLRGYDYDRHFGGVFYVFLRGVTATGRHDYGVFRDRPTTALVHALTNLTVAS